MDVAMMTAHANHSALIEVLKFGQNLCGKAGITIPTPPEALEYEKMMAAEKEKKEHPVEEKPKEEEKKEEEKPKDEKPKEEKEKEEKAKEEKEKEEKEKKEKEKEKKPKEEEHKSKPPKSKPPKSKPPKSKPPKSKKPKTSTMRFPGSISTGTGYGNYTTFPTSAPYPVSLPSLSPLPLPLISPSPYTIHPCTSFLLFFSINQILGEQSSSQIHFF